MLGALLPFGLGLFALFYLYSSTFGQPLYGIDKIELLNLHEERDGVPPLATTKALVNTPAGRYVERGGLL